MGDVILKQLRELSAIDADLHLLCPRSPDSEDLSFYDEDVVDILQTETDSAKQLREQRVAEAEKRRDLLLETIKIFAFDGADAKPYQVRLEALLKTQLTRCDVCVRQYHRSRGLLLERLEQEFEAEDIRNFIEKFDDMNNRRIVAGLDDMTKIMTNLPPDKRNILAAGDVAMYALFEALNCIPFLKNEDALRNSFDTPFRLVQTKKKLKLNSYAPGMVAFLFSKNDERFAWAVRNFAHVKRPLTSAEFVYSVKPFWEDAMARVNITFLDAAFLPFFWRASRTIINKLTRDLLANHVRSMNLNLYTQGLEHFQLDLNHFDDLLASYQKLLEIDPTVFWGAFDSISPQAVAETMLRSPAIDKALTKAQEDEPMQLSDKLSFMMQFINTIQPRNLVSPACFIIDLLLHKLQHELYTNYARHICWETGMTCLHRALEIVNTQIKSGPIVVHMLQQVASNHFALVVQDLKGVESKNELAIDSSTYGRLEIVQLALRLGVSELTFDRNKISKAKNTEHEIDSKSLDVWKMSTKKLKPGNPFLPAAILSGSSGLLLLEEFTQRQMEGASRSIKEWNTVLDKLLDIVSSDFLGGLESFSSEQLAELFREPRAAYGLLALLFSGDSRLHQATLSVLKVLTLEDSRRGCLVKILDQFTSLALYTTSKVLSTITSNQVFGACRIALKICTDLLSGLCDSHDGILRSRKLSEKEIDALAGYWENSWQLLGTTFERMEPWSLNLGHDKDKMKDFCREAMDFATFAFEQYPILVSSLQEDGSRSEADVRKSLLEHPRKHFVSMCKWLRLRDEYLVSKAVTLSCNILRRLQEVDILVDNEAAEFIHGIVGTSGRNAKTKSNATMGQKAELQSAMDKHFGDLLDDILEIDGSALEGEAPLATKSQSTLQQWASSGRSSGTSTPSYALTKPKQGAIDVDAWSKAAEKNKYAHYDDDAELKKLIGSMDASERYKATMGKQHQQQQMQQKKKPLIPTAVKPVAKPQTDQKGFLAKRQKEKEEAEKRRAMALAKAKGVPITGAAGMSEALKGENVMVSSSEESDDDDDNDMDEDLFGPSKKQARKIDRPNVDPNGAIGLKPEQKNGPTRIKRTARSHKDMRARLAPDLTSLHKTILQWDFFHKGDYPPGADEYQFRAVASTFSDPVTYQQTFQPLLTLEAWQGLVKSREENANKPFQIKIGNRSNVDSFLEISTVISNAEFRDVALSDGDIVLISKAAKPADDASAPHCLARIHRIKRQKGQCEVIYQVMSGTSFAMSLVQQAVVNGLKIHSITPLEREYGALQALQYYDLCTQITKAKPSKRMEFSAKQLASYQDVWNVNRAQSEAINAAMENEGFSLIQGPPGSGKTKTIVAIVGGLISPVLDAPARSGNRITMPKAHGNNNIGMDAAPRKLLVCAPSNAAVDELVMRLKEGIITKSGRRHELNVVRIGRSDAINTQVMDVTMDELVSKRLGQGDKESKARERNADLFKEHEKISKTLRELLGKKDSNSTSGEEVTKLENEIAAVRKRKNELGVRIDNVKDAERNAGRDAELNRKKAQQAILDEAHVICATLSGSGHDMFQSLNIEFETVIIDEAAQCVEMSSLIPLKYGCVKCIMVGDPKQLPPTVFSQEAARFAYEQSLFVRMQNNHPNEVHLLDTQYRMHPDISAFPSRAFYDGLLKDGQGMASIRRRPWHASALLSPYRFFDVAGQHQSAPKGHSLINLAEIDVAMALFERLTTDFRDYEYTGRVGVITPYKSQLRALKERFSARFGNSIFDTIEFNTTDAFQGRESEIIIFSCVRASPAGGIGFLQDIRRMNVGLTRAKSSLWVLGNGDSLSRGAWWKKLVDDSRARDSYTTGKLSAMLERPSSAFPAKKYQDTAMHDVEPKRPASTKSDQPITNGKAPEGHAEPKSIASGPSADVDGGPRREISDQKRRKSSPPQDSDRMEGVTYRYEDRVARNKAIKLEDTTKPAGDRGSSMDVEMIDGDETVSSNVPSPMSRVSSPTAETKAGAATDDHSKPPARRPIVAPPVHRLNNTKRSAPSPFLPRKQPRPH